MKDKYLGREGIEEKYDSRKKVINYFRDIATIGGGTFCLLSTIEPNNIKEVLMYGGIGVLSYLSGTGISRLNSKFKEKAIKNLENNIIN